MLRGSFGGLVDVRLSPAEEDVVRSAISERVGEVVGFHKLRTRKAGSQRYVDLHLVMPRDISVGKAHRLCDELERDIMSMLPHASVVIHVEPCSEECDQCPIPPHLRHNRTSG